MRASWRGVRKTAGRISAMVLPIRTKVRRPDLAGTPSADRVGWIAPPGHYPIGIDGDFLDEHGEPNTRTKEFREPPDDSGNWVVVWWQGITWPDGGHSSAFYRWEYVPLLEILEYPAPG